MGYIEETLGKDEKVIYQCNGSKWGGILGGLLFGFLMCFFNLGVFNKSIGFVFSFVGGLVEGVIFGLLIALLNKSVVLGFTNRRVVAKHGIFSRKVIELNIAKIETVGVNQDIVGRMFNYGDLVIAGAGNPNAPIKGIDKPMEFRRRLMEYLEEMKQGEAKA